MRVATDPEMKAIIAEHLETKRRWAIEAIHEADNAVARFEELAAEAAQHGVRHPGVTLRESATDLIERLQRVASGEFA